MKRVPAILLVDDNDQDRKIILRLLRRMGWEAVAEAADAGSGIELAQRDPVDLAIIDTVLPGVEGFEVCRRVRQLRPAARIIMITGHIDALDAGKARKAGADDYVVKTSGGEPLTEAIDRAMKDFA